MDLLAPIQASLDESPRGRRGRARTALRIEDWPEPDRAAWNAAFAPGSLLDRGDRGAAKWRSASRNAVARSYGLWLAFLDRHGALAAAPDPASRLTLQQTQAFIAWRRENGSSSVTLATTLCHLAMAGSAMWQESDWGWLRRLRAGLQRAAMPSRRKTGRLVPPAALLNLGRDLMAEADRMPERLRVTAARRYRDGLLIAFTALSLLRRSNVQAIELGRHLTKDGEVWGLQFAAEETKGGVEDVRLFPPTLVPALERYLAHYRPLFATRCRGPRSQALWLGPQGRSLSGIAIWQLVTRHTEARLGIKVNPHLFRDAGVTFLGNEDPEHVRMGARLLGHSTFQTTERHYIRAQSRNAVRLHQEAVMAPRASSRSRRSGKRS